VNRGGENKGVKIFLKVLFAAIFVWMVFATVRTSMEESLIAAMPAYAKNPWAMATLYDAYCGFITFFVWVAYKENSWLPRVLWFVLIMALGNIAMSAYVLMQLFRLRPEDGVECLLRKQVS
jgi:hypothetical protein